MTLAPPERAPPALGGGIDNSPPTSSVAIQILHHNTHGVRVNRFNDLGTLMTPSAMSSMVSDLSARFHRAKDSIEYSGWSFLKCSDFRICLLQYRGRSLEKNSQWG